MKLIFMGTPQFAVPTLKCLIDNYNVNAVFTQPDRPKGRGKKLCASPVKELAVKSGIAVYQPDRIKKEIEYIEIIKKINPDFIIVVAFGQILSKEILEIPRYGCINLHASLLPKYRGSAPINWSIINGETVTGNTTMLMDEGIDTGDILLKNEMQISPDMTFQEVHDALMVSGGKLMLETIQGIVKGDIVRTKQDDAMSCYAPMISKETGNIDWKASSISIKNLIRGLNPYPAAHTLYKDINMKIFDIEILDEKSENSPGSIKGVSKHGIKVSTGDNNILIKKIQFPGGKPLNVEDYLRGNDLEKNVVLT